MCIRDRSCCARVAAGSWLTDVLQWQPPSTPSTPGNCYTGKACGPARLSTRSGTSKAALV
eukprot:9265950-Prorocentrum_lima.AAC.1